MMTDIEKYSELNTKMQICTYEILWGGEMMKKATEQPTKEKIAAYLTHIKSKYDSYKKEQDKTRDSIIDSVYEVADPVQRKILLSNMINGNEPRQVANELGYNKDEYRIAKRNAIKSFKGVVSDDK